MTLAQNHKTISSAFRHSLFTVPESGEAPNKQTQNIFAKILLMMRRTHTHTRGRNPVVPSKRIRM